jgi:bis(5'-nucleosidyl)-tetraphosphatase
MSCKDYIDRVKECSLSEEHSAGAVIFRRAKDDILYLLLHYAEGHWGSPKGHTEKTETDEETARREIAEETGLTDISFVPGFKENFEYSFVGKKGLVNKTVTFFLAETGTKKITLSAEHTEADWLTYEQALERITFDNEKELFKKARLAINR